MENVMLNGVQTQIKIVDFGLSNVWSPGSMLRTHCGSPEYAAPELFVTGKQYGPEVDLWSLGIILYGMVVGQLPFVSNHGEHVSSQERRKKLVAQINKGLGSQHRRSLATLSSEFRNMMNKLLVADTSKRIKIKELVVHPWITEKGRKLIRTNPIKDLDSHWQAKIISEISALLQEDVKEVLSSIQEDPMGDAGAMYRILVHHHSLKLLSGDGVTRNVPSLDLNTIDFANYRHSPMMLPMTSRSAAKKHADLNRGDNGFIPKVNLSVDPTDELLIKMRPATVQLTRKTSQAYPDYRCIKSPALRRKAYSASITPKSIRTSPDDSRRVFTSPKPKHDSEEQKKPTIIDKSDTNAKKSNDSGFGWRKIACLGKSSSKQNREKSSRIQTAIDRNKPRSKSDHRPNNRPATCNSGPYYNLKNKQANSDMTVITTQSDSRATKKGGMDPKTFLKQRILKSPQYMEKNPQASGDSTSKPNTAGSNSNTKAHRKPVIYDPIARSIAGYVVNNVPDKIQNLASLRK